MDRFINEDWIALGKTTSERVASSIYPYSHPIWALSILLYWVPHIKRILASNAYAKGHRYWYPILATHVAASLVEIARFYGQVWITGGQTPEPLAIDGVLCAIQAFTSLYMAAKHQNVPRGTPELTRATFDCMAIQRLFATAMALQKGSRAWHQASITLLSNFAYARFFIVKLIPRMAGFDTYQARYSAGIVGCHLMGLWEGQYPWGMAMYAALMFQLLWVDKLAQGQDK